MGKSQKKKAMRRHNPMRVPDSHLSPGLAAAAEASKKKEQILPILQKMESPDASERKWACVAVSNIIQNDPSTRRLLQGNNVVGSLIIRLTDNEEEVVAEATGALRNLCVDGGPDICGEMYNKQILTPLKTFVPKISNTLSQYLENPKSAPENAQKTVYEFADNVITIFWCLSETSNKALTTINQSHLVPFLMSFLLHQEKLPVSTVASAAQCLYILTDDNPPAIKEIRPNSSFTSCLVSIAQGHGLGSAKTKTGDEERKTTLRVLSSGILRNVSPLPPMSAAAAVDLEKEVILPLLQPLLFSTSLREDAQKVEDIVKKQASHPSLEKLSIQNTPKLDHKSPEELELERLETKLRTIQLGLEILTSVCATLPDPEMEMESEEGADEGPELDEMEEDEDLDIDMTPNDSSILNGNGNLTTNFLPNLIHPLLALIEPTSLSFPPAKIPSPHPPSTSALGAIHVCAFECLNNIFLSLASSPHPAISADVDSGKKMWQAIWSSLGNIGEPTAIESPSGGRRKLWEIGVGVLWGISIVFKGSIPPEEQHVQTLLQLSEAAGNDEGLKVKCIGTLECLAQYPNSVSANKIISDYLISLLPKTSSSTYAVEPTLQAVSALIDIYSDEALLYDINFRQGRFLDHLINSVEGVRKLVRGINRKKEGGGELRRRGEEVRDNLVDFIGYRRSLGV